MYQYMQSMLKTLSYKQHIIIVFIPIYPNVQKEKKVLMNQTFTQKLCNDHMHQ